jgi:proteasome lid subunit RPN8/RPN11
MTLNDAFEGRSQKGAPILLAVLASLFLAFGRHDGIGFGAVLALAAVVVPTGYMLVRRMLAKVQQRETEERLMMHTRTYLQNEEPVHGASASRAIDGRKLPLQELLGFDGIAAVLPAADPVVFDALPRHFATQTFCATMPELATSPMGELLPVPAAENQPVEFSDAVLDEIRIRAAEGYQRMRHGGVEVGGVLFGKRLDGVLHILAVRPIACEFSHGPRFVLSERDEIGLAELLLAANSDAELEGLEPAGYYHSHTREEICLSEADLEFFDRFFPLPGLVALVVRPANLAPTRAGYFIRQADGRIGSECGDREFELTAAETAAA